MISDLCAPLLRTTDANPIWLFKARMGAITQAVCAALCVNLQTPNSYQQCPPSLLSPSNVHRPAVPQLVSDGVHEPALVHPLHGRRVNVPAVVPIRPHLLVCTLREWAAFGVHFVLITTMEVPLTFCRLQR
jgi:hypothetical protein